MAYQSPTPWTLQPELLGLVIEGGRDIFVLAQHRHACTRSKQMST
jgi:hypothetical protein